MFQKVFPHTRTQNLTWLNSVAWPGYNGAKGWDLAMVNMTYGNEAGMAWHYSHAVILIEVPKRGERLGLTDFFGFWQFIINSVFGDLTVGQRLVSKLLLPLSPLLRTHKSVTFPLMFPFELVDSQYSPL
jgi:hypothetical protein